VTETLPRFEDILEVVSGYNPECDEDLLRRAYVYSAMAHRGQMRVSGEPYLVHPLEVARTLAEMHLDDVAIATGLLHDLLEDTWVSEEELEEQFGEHITGLVKALTKITTMEQS
jgi:guanosine-3',5'-bis(diphosphate) 3'-pyrophosphohydrolase